MRMTADQVDHRPSCFLYDGEANDVERVYIPIQKDVVVREHIDQVQEKEAYIESFLGELSSASAEAGCTFHYRNALIDYMKVKKIEKNVKKLVMEALDGINR